MEPASKVLGRCWEFRPTRPDGPLRRRKGSWDKVYQRTSLSIGATRQMHTLEQWGEKKLRIELGEAGWKPSCPAGSQSWERK